jgi:hypothetical protein
MLKSVVFLMLALGTVIVCSCDGDAHFKTGPLKTESVDLARGNTERANLELDMGTGQLNLDAGGSSLVSGNFQFNVPELEPTVHTTNNGSHAVITIRQPSHTGFSGHRGKDTWNLHLDPSVLWDMTINCGAGQAKLDLGAAQLRSMDVNIGVGQVDLNLAGSPKRDYDISISGGVGQATVHLPKDVGIWAEAHGGLGSIDVSGLEKQGDHYENALYNKAKVNVHVKVDGGVGQIRLIG